MVLLLVCEEVMDDKTGEYNVNKSTKCNNRCCHGYDEENVTDVSWYSSLCKNVKELQMIHA